MANEVDSELTSAVTDPSSGSLSDDKTTVEGASLQHTASSAQDNQPQIRVAENENVEDKDDKMRVLSSTQTETVPHSDHGSTKEKDKEKVNHSGKREIDSRTVATSETETSKETEKARDINERGDGFKGKDKENKKMGEDEDQDRDMNSKAEDKKESRSSLEASIQHTASSAQDNQPQIRVAENENVEDKDDKMRVLSSTQTGTIPHSDHGSTKEKDKEKVNHSGKREIDSRTVATSETETSKETEKARDINERGDGFKGKDKENKKMGEDEDQDQDMNSNAEDKKESRSSLEASIQHTASSAQDNQPQIRVAENENVEDKDDKMRVLSSTQTETIPHSDHGSTKEKDKEKVNHSGKREIDSRTVATSETETSKETEKARDINERGDGFKGKDKENKKMGEDEDQDRDMNSNAEDKKESRSSLEASIQHTASSAQDNQPQIRVAENENVEDKDDKMRVLSSTQTETIPHSDHGSTKEKDKEKVNHSGKREIDSRTVATSETETSKETEKARDINERGDGFKGKDKENKKMGEDEDQDRDMNSNAEDKKESRSSLEASIQHTASSAQDNQPQIRVAENENVEDKDDKMRVLSSTQTETVPHSDHGSTKEKDKEKVNHSGKREIDSRTVATSETETSKETEKARDINERGDGFKGKDKENKKMGEDEDQDRDMNSKAEDKKESRSSLEASIQHTASSAQDNQPQIRVAENENVEDKDDKMRVLSSTQTGTIPHSDHGSTKEKDKEKVNHSGKREIDSGTVATSETETSKETEKARDINERGDGFKGKDKENKKMGEDEDQDRDMNSNAEDKKESRSSLEESLKQSSGFLQESQPQMRVGGNGKLFGIYAVVALLASVVCGKIFFSDSTPPVTKEFNVVDVFNQEMEKLKTSFPNQQPELWRRSLIHLRRHLKTEQPTEPVSLILTSGHRAERTLGCLAQCLAHAFSTARNSSVLNIDGKNKASQDSDQVKLDIDSELRNAFEGKKFAAVIHRFEELPPGSTLIFYRYCDHENAAYKDVFLAFTVMLDTEVEVPSNISLGRVEDMVHDHVKQKFVSSDKSAKFNQMDVDKLSGLWSRISHLILPVAAEEKIEHQGCGGDCGK